MVRAVGLEPTLLAEPDFESGASTNFTTPAYRPARGGRGSSSSRYNWLDRGFPDESGVAG